MSYLSEHFKDFDCDVFGNVYKNGKLLSQCNSNGYKQVTMRDENFKRRILGVHVVVAMKYLDYFDGCVVHHKDKNRGNNRLENLEVKDLKEHCREHAFENESFRFMNINRIPWNKGKKMSEEFSLKCKRGIQRYKDEHNGSWFRGNQFVDSNGNRR